MGAFTIWDKITHFFWYDPIAKIEYYFAKRWLDKNFGKREYWGDFLSECFKNLDL